MNDQRIDRTISFLFVAAVMVLGVYFLLSWICRYVDYSDMKRAATIFIYALVAAAPAYLAVKILGEYRKSRVTTVHKDDNAVIHGKAVFSAVNFNKSTMASGTVNPQITAPQDVEIQLFESIRKENARLRIELDRAQAKLIEGQGEDQKNLEWSEFYRSKVE